MTPTPAVAAPDGAELAAELAAAPSLAECCAVLEEFAWRSLLAGVRVRDYCDEANRIVQAAPPKGLRLALASTPVRLLFPYALAAGAPLTSFTPSVLVPAAFAHISRKQLIDALVRLSRDGGYPATVEARTLELLLEYIGRRWRSAVAGEDIVDGITKKLAEVEFEVGSSSRAARHSSWLTPPQVTLRGEPTSARATIVPTLQLVRFNLGFVSSAHLIARLNSAASGIPDSAAQPLKVPQMVKAWAVRRLAMGADTQSVATELLTVRERVLDPIHRDDILNALVALGLESEGAEMSAAQPSPPQPPLAPLGPRTRTTSRVSLKPPKRKTLAVFQWLPHRHGSNASVTPPVAPDWERRPSLPTLFEPADTTPSWGHSDLPYLTASSSTLARSTTPPSRSRTAHETIELHMTLLRRLLGFRYRLGANTDGWYFGSGRKLAIELLESVEGSPDMVDSLRSLLSLSTEVQEDADNDVPPAVPAKDVPSPKAAATSPPPAVHQRDVSFDLDEYLEAIRRPDDSPANELRGPFSWSRSEIHEYLPDSPSPPSVPVAGPSTHRSSPSFMTTPTRSDVTPTRSSNHHREESLDSVYSNTTAVSRPLSVMSDFTILEATRVTVRAVEVRFPLDGKPLVLSRGDEIEEVIPDNVSEPDDAPAEWEAPLPHSKSMSHLDQYTALPERLNRRRRPRAPVGGLLPAFNYSPEEPVPSLSKRPSTQFPCPITPPLSPVNTHEEELSDRTPMSLMEPLFPRKQVSSADLRSRRLKFRQCVIVDGTPTRTAFSGPASHPEVIQDQTALGAVLKLFGYGARFVMSSALDPVEVEQALVAAIDLEALRILDRGELFDAEARARVAWLLEQVACELTQPDLISAVQRALEYLAMYEVGTSSPRTLRSAPSFSATHASAGLEITTPPRDRTRDSGPEITISTAPPRGGFFDDLEPPSSCSSDTNTTLETPLVTVDFSTPTPRRRVRVQSASPSVPETPVPATRYHGGRQLDILPTSPMTPSPGTPCTPLTSAILVHAL
ncbi:uncharacterized protein LOC62_03G005045 [Vanrija pseudolonga]|uniref:Uncharacterized protein n=1 Tax=Vanrija pseudolonga TaxID=143232 RepID=A0AAF1BQZ4_9TREE|nr:hypothetical protein LOC62_03G005045 [Vanrija pseudolonga]